MYISAMTIGNYRTFRHVVLTFDSRVNYIVGDNNIGKSNFLSLLKTITHGYGFRETDFMDPDQPISVAFTLSSADEGESGEARLLLTQKVTEVVPVLTDRKTGERLPLEYMRCLFYTGFELSEIPRNMVDEDSVAAVLHLFQDYFSSSDSAVAEVNQLMEERGFPVNLPEQDPHQAALLLFRDVFGSYAAGTSYDSTMKLMIATGAALLVKMLRKKESRAISFDNMVVQTAEGKRKLALILSIDEPELHLHPYLQRAILSFLTACLNNEEPFFLKLVQGLLGVDGLDGQLFVVTHSTDALVNDYRRIIRMYWDDTKKVQAACGASFHFDREIEKHLIMHFPEVKEALYSRAAILVEGETEYGSFPYFARTLGVHLDYHGICLINARGESSISKISKLIRRFHIPAVSLYDRDVMVEHGKSDAVFYTDYLCYEMDVVKACLSSGSRRLLDGVIADVEEAGDVVNSALVKKAGAKLGVPKGCYPPRKLKNINPRDEKALEFYYFAWLYGNKGVIIGRALGERLPAKVIPPAFARVIQAAVAFSDGHGEKNGK